MNPIPRVNDQIPSGRLPLCLVAIALCLALSGCYVKSAARHAGDIAKRGWDFDRNGPYTPLTGTAASLLAGVDLLVRSIVPLEGDGYLITQGEPEKKWFRAYRGPMLPLPLRVRKFSEVTPGGTSTSISRSDRTRPSPEQTSQGRSMTRPSPRQPRHGWTLTNWPKTERWTWRSSPEPWHTPHVTGDVPGSAPLPLQRGQSSKSATRTVLVTPFETSAKVIGSRMRTV